MGYKQHSKVWQVADKRMPNRESAWQPLTEAQRAHLVEHSEVYAYLADGEEAKWYEEEADLEAFSRAFPGCLFVSDSTGEDGEHWRVFACDGRVVRVVPFIAWPPPWGGA